MRKYFLLSILFISVCSIAKAQKVKLVVNYVTSNGPADNSTIFYDGKTKLVWNDFQGKPDNSVDFAALTSSGSGFNLAFESTNNVTTMTIDVYCDYSKPESWVKKDKESDYILNHEQHHFDLTYIYTQRFIKKLREADVTMKNYQKLIGNIYEDVEKELNAEQTKYDDETQHSVIKEKQEEWNKKIDDELAALKDSSL